MSVIVLPLIAACLVIAELGLLYLNPWNPMTWAGLFVTTICFAITLILSAR